MNYRHLYHAGNFADVAKHVALLYCLESLKRKEAAFFVLDTHAGRGEYNLTSPEAARSGEAARGVQRLVAAELGAALAGYLAALGAVRGQPLERYPGSPVLIARALRPQDRACFVEQNPAEARAAERCVDSPGRVAVEAGDGYAALRARLPPPERRGLVLIDPPYERLDELDLLEAALAEAWRRWQTGIFLAWYPIRSAAQRRSVHARLAALAIPKLLTADLAVHPDDAGIGLAGSGVAIINPPYGADDYLREAYGAIHDVLAARGAGYVEVERLTAERAAPAHSPRTHHGT